MTATTETAFALLDPEHGSAHLATFGTDGAIRPILCGFRGAVRIMGIVPTYGGVCEDCHRIATILAEVKLASCGEYCADGYRTDVMSPDHYGEDSPAIRACDAGTMPCPDHRCYSWATSHRIRPRPTGAGTWITERRADDETDNRNGTHTMAYRLTRFDRLLISEALKNETGMVGSWLRAVIDHPDSEADIAVTITVPNV